MKRALADVLWEAANWLLPVETYSCHATASAEFGHHWRERCWDRSPAQAFLRDLGCTTHNAGFKDFYDEEEVLGVRYMWLLLAMHVAESERIEI